MCNHDINSKETTIFVDLKKKTMVSPHVYMGMCRVCKEVFKFKKDGSKFSQIK